HVGALASLLQGHGSGRRGVADWIQRQYAKSIRVELARAFGVRADLPPTELARLIAERRPVDERELAAGLAAVDGSSLGDRALLQRVRALESLRREIL